MSYPITLSGSLISSNPITDEELEDLQRKIDAKGLAGVAIARKDGETIRIDFAYDGPTTRDISPGNFGFGELVAYVSNLGTEMNLTLEGNVLIHQLASSLDYFDGNAQLIYVEDGTAFLKRGKVQRSGFFEWDADSTEVKVTVRVLNR